ncbi:MAG: hypothetical protein WCP79_08805 [Bacillota bacterium]
MKNTNFSKIIVALTLIFVLAFSVCSAAALTPAHIGISSKNNLKSPAFGATIYLCNSTNHPQQFCGTDQYGNYDRSHPFTLAPGTSCYLENLQWCPPDTKKGPIVDGRFTIGSFNGDSITVYADSPIWYIGEKNGSLVFSTPMDTNKCKSNFYVAAFSSADFDGGWTNIGGFVQCLAVISLWKWVQPADLGVSSKYPIHWFMSVFQ